MSDLEQALRNAIEVERAAARFYQKLARKAGNPGTRAFLEGMARDESSHAEAFEHKSRELGDGRLPDWPDMRLENVEAAPEWDSAEEISYAEALQVALEAEQHAELFYDAIADTATVPSVRAFFREIASTEGEHAKRIAGMIEEQAGH